MTEQEVKTVLTIIDLCTQSIQTKQSGYYSLETRYMDENHINKLKKSIREVFLEENK